VSAAYCEGEQVARPAPTEGLTLTPGGRETTTFRTGGRASWEGSVRFLRFSLSRKAYPDGEEALVSLSCPVGFGAKTWPLQDMGASAPPDVLLIAALETSAGCCQESAVALNSSGPEQALGRVT